MTDGAKFATVVLAGSTGRELEPTMLRICTEHQTAHADATARVNVPTALAMRFSWITTKPYGSQRPSGVAPS